jgi:ribokinase
LDFLENFLIRTDILLINQAELKLLTTGNIADSRISPEKYETQEIAEKVQLEYGIEMVVVKMGDNGSYVTYNGKSHIANAFDVPCVDTTGAGDAFNAGFLHGYINGENIKKMALKGNYIASCCITEHGTTNGLPDITKLEDIINNQ